MLSTPSPALSLGMSYQRCGLSPAPPPPRAPPRPAAPAQGAGAPTLHLSRAPRAQSPTRHASHRLGAPRCLLTRASSSHLLQALPRQLHLQLDATHRVLTSAGPAPRPGARTTSPDPTLPVPARPPGPPVLLKASRAPAVGSTLAEPGRGEPPMWRALPTAKNPAAVRLPQP